MKTVSQSHGGKNQGAYPRTEPQVSLPLIKAYADEIARRFKVEKIILFGSWAYGQPDADSDVDLLIIMSFEGSPFRQAGKILNGVAQSIGVLPLDLLVRTSDQLHERLAIDDNFTRDILERGKVLYEAQRA